MNILLGVGNSLLSDDGAGVYIADSFKEEGWLSYNCGTAPENFTSVVRREHPKILVIVDAARMGLSPGEFRQIPKDRISDVSFGTHQLPLSQLTIFLKDLAEEIIIIGIEPKSIEPGEGLSPEVRDACREVAGTIKKSPESIPRL